MTNYDQYLPGKKLSDIFKGNDEALQKMVFEGLTLTYKPVFFTKILSFPSLIRDEEFITAAENSFVQTLVLFSHGVKQQTGKSPKEGYEKQLLLLFKNTYHRLMAEKLNIAGIENEIASSLLQMSGECKDYLTWYYINQFSLMQINAITGAALPFIKNKLWNCRKMLQKNIKQSFSLLPDDTFDENRFLLLANYFENELPDEADAVHQLNESDVNAHKNDALELLLRYRVPGNQLLKKNEEDRKDSYLSASEFIELAKQDIKRSFP